MIRSALGLLLVLMLGGLAEAQGPTVSVKSRPGRIRFTTVDKHSLYEKVGFKAGDVVREINGKAADENARLYDIDEVIRKGGTIKVERKGKLKVLKIKPTEMEAPEPTEEFISEPAGE